MRQFLAACAALALIPAAGSLQAAAIGAGSLTAGYETLNAPAVRSVSVVPASGRAEIVIGVDASVDVDDFALESPHRVVVDLKGAVLGMAPTLRSAGARRRHERSRCAVQAERRSRRDRARARTFI